MKISNLKALNAFGTFFILTVLVLTPFSYGYINPAQGASSNTQVNHNIQQAIAVADAEALASLLKSVPQSEIQQSFTVENPFVVALTQAERCSPDILDLLIAAEAPLLESAGGNALHYIGYFSELDNNLNCLKKLLQLGADINQQDHDGYTPLVKLLYSQNEHATDLISYMLEQGANPFIRSPSGMDFLHHALALQLLYSEQLHFLAEDDPLYFAANKMVTTTQLARKLYAEYYTEQQRIKLQINNSSQ
ncbi:ankyrin repeat domain-containing protein [Rheinheimera baltica]|uniref:Ankyrin repeat domain-containing protein n=1 Tax=Rheinheimera baltica TaxID=67576 RepID=A0ABT9I5B7_9GAMM|nr:ankyrin repeat domain-containing protein [Rheinheimera baltica]MDP5138593.1 ankyrin repeat domain-containing protein [Rheinheimera baltica]MDP5150649.1 ankyrin repeat domain-containing protein [Rheinheimera baltica]